MKSKEEIKQLANDYGKSVGNTDGTTAFDFKLGYSQCQRDMADNSKVTRFEVIDENGRAYTQRDCKVELSYQDDNRTLKVFIKSNKQD